MIFEINKHVPIKILQIFIKETGSSTIVHDKEGYLLSFLLFATFLTLFIESWIITNII